MISFKLRLTAVAALALGLLAYAIAISTGDHLWPGVRAIPVGVALLIVVIVIDYLDVALPIGAGSFSFAVSAPVMMAASMHFGAAPGALIVGTALIVDDLIHRRALTKSVTNTAAFLSATCLAGVVYGAIANTDRTPVASLVNFGAAVVAALIFSLVGTILLSFVVAPAVGESALGIFRSGLPTVGIDVVSIPTLGSLVVVLAQENAIAVLLLLLPLLAPQLAYRTLQRAQRDIRDTIESLADAIERRDRYTANHSSRVAGYTRAMLAEMPDIPDGLAETIMAAARVHDVGKVGVKDSTLLKPGPLTTEERLDLQMHTIVGAEIVSRIAEYRLCAAIIRHHHERWDGAGYPDGLSGEDIPIGSRIICVADAFDAMTSDRPYRRAMSAEAAIEEVRRSAGSQFDPRVVAAFERVMAVPARQPVEPRPTPLPQVTPTPAS